MRNKYDFTFEYVGLVHYEVVADSMEEALEKATAECESNAVPVLDKFVEANPDHDIQFSTGAKFCEVTKLVTDKLDNAEIGKIIREEQQIKDMKSGRNVADGKSEYLIGPDMWYHKNDPRSL